MTRRQRRLTVVLATLVAVASVVAAGLLAYPPRPDRSPVLGSPAVPVLSPRRAPEFLHTFVADTRLAGRVGAFMRRLSPTSCAVVRADASTILSHHPDELLTPASALKLTTAAAFLARVGGKGHFTTSVGFQAPDASGSVPYLVVTGDGDPLLATPGYVATRKHPPKPATDFTAVVAKLRAAGVRRVTRGIRVDDDIYDAERRVPTWSAGYTATGDVGPIGALALNDGFSAYTPRLVAAPDPAIAVGDELRAELVADGIPVDGPTQRGRAAPGEPGKLVELHSAPYADVVSEMLKESDNNTAELLLKRLPRRGSTPATRAAAVEARARALKALGVDADAVKAVDGSGLDRSDRTTCAALLTTLTTRPGGYDIEDMLAIAGKTGTLTDRFTTSALAGKLRAKTGSLDNVTALVGVTDPAGASKLRFAFMSNGAFSDAGGKAMQDRLVAALATYPEAPPAAALQP